MSQIITKNETLLHYGFYVKCLCHGTNRSYYTLGCCFATYVAKEQVFRVFNVITDQVWRLSRQLLKYYKYWQIGNIRQGPECAAKSLSW